MIAIYIKRTNIQVISYKFIIYKMMLFLKIFQINGIVAVVIAILIRIAPIMIGLIDEVLVAAAAAELSFALPAAEATNVPVRMIVKGIGIVKENAI